MLKGVFTAIVTPFTKDGTLDETTFRKLIDKQVAAGVAGIVPCGTTGESPTLSNDEHKRVISICCEQVAGRCEIIAGTGSNSTDEAINMTKHAKEAGATATLQVLPYYNKPNQRGLYKHYEAIASAVELPIMVYNIKGRCAINMETSTLASLAKIDTIVAVKEASGSIHQVMDVVSQVPDDFSVLSGDDVLTLPLMACGGHGVVSVASNVIPGEMVALVNAGLNGDFASMKEMHYNLKEFFNKLFIETNPIPVKQIMALMGQIEAVYRLPICEATEESVAILKKLASDYKLV
jgi:4-hydroxy-tetrahydrodipicolinate synthase